MKSMRISFLGHIISSPEDRSYQKNNRKVTQITELIDLDKRKYGRIGTNERRSNQKRMKNLKDNHVSPGIEKITTYQRYFRENQDH